MADSHRLTEVKELAFERAALVIARVREQLQLPKPPQDELRALFEAITQAQPEQYQQGYPDFVKRFGQEEWDRQFHLAYLRSLRAESSQNTQGPSSQS